jgi:uncharacterized protein YbcI
MAMDKAQASLAGGEARLGGGHLLAAISNRMVRILRERYGRGPMKAKTYALDDLIIVVMRGSGFTDAIEELTGRNVVAFLSQAHVDPDLTMEIFFVDRPLRGFGALELVEPE